MDPLAAHRARVAHLREAFAEANERLVARLRGAEDEAAARVPEGGWSAAQIGWHVARVTTRFAGIMSGEMPGAQPVPADFCERPWPEIVQAINEHISQEATQIIQAHFQAVNAGAPKSRGPSRLSRSSSCWTNLLRASIPRQSMIFKA